MCDLNNLVLKKTVSLTTTGTVGVPDTAVNTDKVKITIPEVFWEGKKLSYNDALQFAYSSRRQIGGF